ncbi:hypothetical protein B0I21_10470 [Sphingobacterium paludis]|jgi:hypothetical protein|uniref:Uncharacterized protein n=1 Tax=Sphingobacterium paludis TaxID=1476465 RepID=A0A4R7D2E0_9SPHI|nr:hypothetical protein B0I21_10470 [Sphingobacterium paludis]
MENIEVRAAQLGLNKGYYMLLMAILEEPIETEEQSTQI